MRMLHFVTDSKRKQNRFAPILFSFICFLFICYFLNCYNNTAIIGIHGADSCSIYNSDIFKFCQLFQFFFYLFCTFRTIAMCDG